jgi:hypothetical protein
MTDLTPESVLADLFSEEGFEIADANGAAQAAIQRLEDSGFQIFDAAGGAAAVLAVAHRGTDRRLWDAYAKAVLAVPPDLVPVAIEFLKHLAEHDGGNA